jgi:hypothetical protein
VKKLLAFVLMFAFVCSLTLSTAGCGKKEEKKEEKAGEDSSKKKKAAE